MKTKQKQGFRIPVLYRLGRGHYKLGYTNSLIPDETGTIMVRIKKGVFEQWEVPEGLTRDYCRLN